MRIGISIASNHPSLQPRAASALMVDHARAAAAAGLATLSVGDLHGNAISHLHNTPMLGRLLAEWDDRPAGCLYLVPLWHPVLMAEHIVTLSAIARGPLIVQTGLGWRRDQFEAMGAEWRARAERLEAGIAVVKRLIAGEVVDEERFGIHGARVTADAPTVEWWISGTVPAAIDRAARLGDCWYANADLTPQAAAEAIGRYHDACARHERPPARIALRRDVHLSESRTEAERVGASIVDGGYRGFDRSAVAYGDPTSVAEQLSIYAGMGFTDVIIRPMTGDPQSSTETIRLAGALQHQLNG